MSHFLCGLLCLSTFMMSSTLLHIVVLILLLFALLFVAFVERDYNPMCALKF